MHSGPSFAGLFTRVLTGKASISSAGYGVSRGSSFAGSWIMGSSHTASASLVRITGMRSWFGFSNSFASVVMIVQDLISSPSGEVHASHSPAKLNGSRVLRVM